MRKPRRLPLEALDPYSWHLPPEYHSSWGDRRPGETYPRIDWRAMFGNDNPIEVEVGFGKGLFLVNSAAANPDVNYFGIEIIRKYQLYAATRIAQRDLKNVKVCAGDAKLVMRDFIPAGSVRTMHIFFPDPWWKARHKKRTLMNPEFIALILQVLIVGGHLHFVTDVEDYFHMVAAMLKEFPTLVPCESPVENTPTHDMDYLTNFERKFRKEGRPIYRSLHVLESRL